MKQARKESQVGTHPPGVHTHLKRVYLITMHAHMHTLADGQHACTLVPALLHTHAHTHIRTCYISTHSHVPNQPRTHRSCNCFHARKNEQKIRKLFEQVSERREGTVNRPEKIERENKREGLFVYCAMMMMTWIMWMMMMIVDND